jgi:hypothetical protein
MFIKQLEQLEEEVEVELDNRVAKQVTRCRRQLL